MKKSFISEGWLGAGNVASDLEVVATFSNNIIFAGDSSLFRRNVPIEAVAPHGGCA